MTQLSPVHGLEINDENTKHLELEIKYLFAELKDLDNRIILEADIIQNIKLRHRADELQFMVDQKLAELNKIMWCSLYA